MVAGMIPSAVNAAGTFYCSTSVTTGGTGTLDDPWACSDDTQLDAIVSYSFQNGLTLFAEGFNLTDEYIRVHGRADLMTNFVTQTGPRYGIGARWTY